MELDDMRIGHLGSIGHVPTSDQVEEMGPQKKSLMAEGVLNTLNDQQVRDLFAYLRSSQPLP